MRIAFDGKRAVQNFTGLGNNSSNEAEILCNFYPENDYVLYAPKKRENKRMNLLTGQYRQLTLAYPATSFWKKLSSLWRVWGITSQLEKEGIELFHGLSNELPLNIHKSRIKSIVTIHDLIFLRYPQYYQSIDRKIYTYKFRKACENADKIIAISECTKRDIIRYFNIPDDKIEVDKISLLPDQTLTWSTDAINWTDEEQKEWQSAEVNYRTGAANKETCVKIYRKMYNLDLKGQLDGVD